MFNKDSDYALNKHSENIVYRQADGSCLEVKPEDCPDFDRWKAFSNADFHDLDLGDWRASNGRLSLNDLTDEDVDPLPSVEDAADLDGSSAPDHRTIENAMAILSQCLTETQRRRYLMHARDGLTVRQIASQEQVDPMVVQRSIQASKKKYVNLFLEIRKKGLQNDPKITLSEGVNNLPGIEP